MTYEERNNLADAVIEFELLGKPTPKGRPRFNTKTGRAYTPTKTKSAENSLLAAYLVSAGNRPPHDGAVELELVATFEPPASWTKKKREAALRGELPHLTTPDFDNLAKIVDGLNGRAWLDDKQIVRAVVTKGYGATASTRLRITFHALERSFN
jgi:Holliday junction resolvase RusA-like endonuclease